MGNIYWLASYPKSGNTWMRILLTNYLRNAQEPADINNLDAGPIASARQVFDDNVGIEASDLTQDEIERLRPFVYDTLSAKADRPFFLKVHDACTSTATGRPLFPTRATAGVIYMLRNPLDVAVSSAHHGGSEIEKAIGSMRNPEAALLASPDRLHSQLRQRLLTWSDHVLSWVDAPRLRVHVVRYEDMLADTVDTFTQTIRFCRLDDEPARIARAVEFSRFERLQRQEQKNGFQERLPYATAPFFRRGEAGSWHDELAPEQIDELISDHRAVMERFGYLTKDGIAI